MSSKNGMMPLAVLLNRELTIEKIDNPKILHGQAFESKKGEDFVLLKTDCQRMRGDDSSTFSVFGLFDGHNGIAAAVYTKENLLNNVLSAIPTDVSRDEWLAALPRALVAGFTKTDKDFQDHAHSSGTTVTFVIIDAWVVTVASVGDSRCVLESAEGAIYSLSADHRLNENKEEVKRVTGSGGEVGRLNTGGGKPYDESHVSTISPSSSSSSSSNAPSKRWLSVFPSLIQIGPLRCWPGGLCLSRSIGDMDVGEFIVPIPHVKQIKLSSAGGRLVISSDGVWDALTFEMALNCCRGLPAHASAAQIVKEAVHEKGLCDDTTCIVIDMLPPEKPSPAVPSVKKSKKKIFKLFRKKLSEPTSIDNDFSEPDLVEEIFEEGSAVLSQRLDVEYPVCNIFKLFMCAICQVEMKPGEGISVHASSSLPGKMRPWDGPLLCKSCQRKKEAMEGKKRLGDGCYRSD